MRTLRQTKQTDEEFVDGVICELTVLYTVDDIKKFIELCKKRTAMVQKVVDSYKYE